MSVLGLVGCGLLGGSFALAARQQKCFSTVLGRDRSRSVEETAKRVGVIDDAWSSGTSVDAVCIAVPTQSIAQTVESLTSEIPSDTPIFDVGSVKASVLRELDDVPSNFIPCHPIAGSHTSGPEAARSDLFHGSVCVISPTSSTNESLLGLVEEWWRGVGSRVITMPANAHDETVALTSHLPHLVSAAAVEMLMNRDQSTADLLGSGFKDFSRIAAGDATMWRSIFVDNLDNIRIGFQDLAARIERMLALAESDPAELERKLQRIATFRDSINGE
ncbi:MAG: prephenate dehydrogenase [Gammaproteobacteria bacterium]|nr:prephenate dehydrogenase [Gammaproteobacteria bacterium]